MGDKYKDKDREKEYEKSRNQGTCTCVEYPSFVCPIEEHALPPTRNTSLCDDINDDLDFTHVGKNGKPLKGYTPKKNKSRSLDKTRDFFLKSPNK